jgi:uncharacterized Zn finger protein
MAKKASVATRNAVMHNMIECPSCSAGSVDLFISGEYIETIKCPDCMGMGMVTPKIARLIIDGQNVLRAAMADVGFKY